MPMTEAPPLTLDVQDRIAAMIDRRVNEARTLIDQRLDSEKAALMHQALEYERRLTLLNGEHATLTQMKNDFVLRVVYDKDIERLRLAAEVTSKEQQETVRKQEEGMQANRRNTMIAWAGFLTALIGWGITILIRYLPVAPHP